MKKTNKQMKTDTVGFKKLVVKKKKRSEDQTKL